MKLSNGNTLMRAPTFTKMVGHIKGRFDSYQSVAEYAVHHLCEHGDKTPLEQFASAFKGARGKLIGDGILVQGYVNSLCYGFKINSDASVTIEIKKSNGKAKPRGFRVINAEGDLSMRDGSHTAGMALTFAQFAKMRAEKKDAQRAEREKAEAEAEEAKRKADEAKKAEEGEEGKAEEGEEGKVDFSRASTIAETVLAMKMAFQNGKCMDIEAMADARAAMLDLDVILAERIAEATPAPKAEAEEAPAEAEAPKPTSRKRTSRAA